MSDIGRADLLTSPLHRRHLSLGAKFAEFSGWSMPVEYTGAVKEHNAVRSAVGIFDVSHLGKALVRGPGAVAYVNSCLTNDLDKIGPGQAQYTLCCDVGGGVVDDLIAYLRSDDEVLLIPNAANATEVVRRLSASAPAGVNVLNLHSDYAILAVQGPASDEVLESIGYPVGHRYMSFVDVEHDDVAVVVCRTGYTGERGYELVVPNQAALSVWDAIMSAGQASGIAAAGLAARDTLRTEMGYPLHGNDISMRISPLQARLGWAIGWKKDSFWGHEALRAEKAAGPTQTLRGLVAAGRGIPRSGMSVTNSAGESIGSVTSGTYSPSRKRGIALALLDCRVADSDHVYVDVRGRREPFVVTKPPFFTPDVQERQGS
ncbi:MAG: glycine cleavage system aminomethyltransferase GcvT [Nocardioidaceae bacterium]|nr:glycine cleavage system aminomethyltransferase GcvT [Nocardioidaceae bacterium]